MCLRHILILDEFTYGAEADPAISALRASDRSVAPAASDLRRPARVPDFRFYFRFFAPFRDELTYRPERVLPLIREGLRSFVGLTAFEELSRHRVAEQGRAGNLPFEPQDVGSHWSRRVQIDVVAVSWRGSGLFCWGSASGGRIE